MRVRRLSRRCRVGFGFFFFSSRRRHTRLVSDWSSDVCSSDLTVKSVTEKPPLVALAGTMTRPAVLTDVHTAFTDGDLVGALHSGAACDKLAQREWSDLIKQRIEAELPRVFNDEMSKVGGLLAGPKSNGAPLQVQPFLNNLDIQVCQPPAGKWQGGFSVQVGWQIVPPDSAQPASQA